jgi:hypothetical protein
MRKIKFRTYLPGDLDALQVPMPGQAHGSTG